MTSSLQPTNLTIQEGTHELRRSDQLVSSVLGQLILVQENVDRDAISADESVVKNF